MFSFNNPIYLNISIILLVVIVVVYIFKNKLKFLNGHFLKFISIALVLIALSDPITKKEIIQNDSTILFDVSESMDALSLDKILQDLKANFPDSIPIKAFSDEISTNNRSLGGISSYSKLVNGVKNRKQTNLEHSINLANERNIILISDGNETRGDIENILNNNYRNKKIFPIFNIDQKQVIDEIKIENIDLPIFADEKEEVGFNLALSNYFSRDKRGSIEVIQDGKLVSKKAVDLKANSREVFILKTSKLKKGIQEIKVKFSSLENNLISNNYITGRTKDKILVISNNQIEEKVIKKIIESKAYQADFKYTSEIDSFLELADYSLLFLNNISKKSLPENFLKKLDQSLEDGNSLVVSGGNKSYGLGGYKNTLMEKILPVQILEPKKEKKRLNIAIELVLDKSGSMSKDSKMDFTKLAARGVINSLKDEDYVGIVGFAASPFVALEPSQLKYYRKKAIERVGRLVPATTTKLLPALGVAAKQLEIVDAGRKHMIILTDGELPDGNQYSAYYLELVEEMKLSGITLSTFIIGNQNGQILEEMADLGGGAFHRTQNASSLPRLFIEDIKVNVGENTQKESEEYLVKVNQIKSSTINEYPKLLGYVETKKKEKADLELLVQGTESLDPLLASWDYKNGRVIAYTSDITSRWVPQWIRWEELSQFWLELIDSLLESDENANSSDYDLKTSYQKNNLILDLSIYSRDLLNELKIELKTPSNKIINPILKQIEYGFFQIQIPNPEIGKYEFYGTSKNSKLEKVAFNFNTENLGEAKTGYNYLLLERLAKLTKGKVNPKLTDVDLKSSKEIKEVKFILPFIILALMIFLLDIYLREVRGIKI